MSHQKLLTPSEFRARTNMSRAKEDRLRRVEKKIPHFRIGARIFYSEEYVAAFLKSCEEQALLGENAQTTGVVLSQQEAKQ